MRLTLPSMRYTTCVLTVLTGLATIVLTADCGQPANAATDCVGWDDLNEKITGIHTQDPNGPFPAVGGSSTFTDYLYDPNDKLVMTNRGFADVPDRAANGHLLEFGFEQFTLDDGAFHTGGEFDITQGFKGDWVTVHAVGTAGRYLGMTGYRKFRLVVPGKLLKAQVKLCRN
jgi:hypothetical protein